ncbi:MAG: c-type cytochrome [Roseinatronobacter sp.]|jgi:cytochrome c|nr:c-type cytochrome [Roseinatronobacter sp.]
MPRSTLAALALAGTLIAPAMAGAQAIPIGDPAAGAELYEYECAACHQIGEDAEHRIGPHLNRIFDRRAGSHPEFQYSEALARQGRDGLHWDLERLDAYIENPRSLVSGTIMGYPGLENEVERADLIAFIRAYSDQPQNIPEASPTARAPEVQLSPEVLEIVGDAEYGAFLSAECVTCHQRSGVHAGIPGIVGWPEEDFVVAMHAYRKRLRPHEVMQTIAQRLDDEEIAALAAYFANSGKE